MIFYANSSEIGVVNNPESKTVFVSWSNFPGEGNYSITAKIVDKSNAEHTIPGPAINLE